MVALATLGFALSAMLVLWVVSRWRRDVSIVDLFWGPGFAGIAWLSFGLSGAPTERALLVAALVTVWGVRLGIYLAWRNWGQGEDRRYAVMRERHGERFPLVSLGTVFGLQGVLMWFISLPLQIAITAPAPRDLTLLDGLGVVLWSVGFLFESVGDAQLARFKSDPSHRGRVMDRGLWRYTRHPNYFGDFLVWWGFFALAATVPGGGWTLVSPLLMSFLLLRVSGVSLLESSIAERRPEYRSYVARTNAFFPGWPRRKAAGQDG